MKPLTGRVPVRGRVLAVVLTVIAAAGVYAHLPSGPALPTDAVADHIIIDKTAHTLTLLSQGRTLKSYAVRLGRNPNGPKTREGDGRTPEGAYFIDYRNPRSGFHLALHVSYPNAEDASRAAAEGVPPGGDIMIHGLPNGLGWLGRLHQLFDWTRGCIAVTDPEIEEIYRAVPDGTPLEIKS